MQQGTHRPVNLAQLPDECRDVACHVWVNTVALPRRNNQTWHATSLHLPPYRTSTGMSHYRASAAMCHVRLLCY
ncbi:MAG: hypothetical protein HDS84_05000 [Bacteroidales bacterium]|nr:hypothetical protein [Bacteroidales bacterium]